MLNDRLLNDRLPNDRLPNDRFLNDRLLNDRLLNDSKSGQITSYKKKYWGHRAKVFSNLALDRFPSYQDNHYYLVEQQVILNNDYNPVVV